MDDRTKELIAIGASVAAHCQPCLEYHVGKSRELGIAEEEIAEAVQVGHRVARGADRAMRQFAAEVVVGTPSVQDRPACCAGPTPQGGDSCC